MVWGRELFYWLRGRVDIYDGGRIYKYVARHWTKQKKENICLALGYWVALDN